MTPGVRHEITILVMAALLLLTIGAITDTVLVLLFLGLLAYVIWVLYNLNKLTRWLAKPTKHTPESSGVWDEMFYQLYNVYKRQRAARKKLTSILNRFQKSTQALPDATIVLNNLNEIEWFNQAASNMFNLHTGVDVGQRIDNLIREPAFSAYLNDRKFRKPLEFQINQRKILLSITPYGSGQFLVSARDVTLRSQLDEMRRDFISNASHELRTPITVMSGYIEMLKEEADESTMRPLEQMQQQTARMESIIAELIELAKLETSAAIDKATDIDIDELLSEVYNEARALDQDRHHIELTTDLADEHIRLRGSYDELRMAFSNLLTNAIRYTPDGGEIKLFATGDDSRVQIGVEDTGIGINYEHIPRLTERFYRVDEGRSREKGGTGLGLSIVKHVLDRHDASLHIHSESGKGSLFRCDFPLTQ